MRFLSLNNLAKFTHLTWKTFIFYLWQLKFHIALALAQKAFVEQDLKAASTNQNIDWIIVYFHKPMYSSPSSCSSCSGESSLRDIYHPLFDKYGVDLSLRRAYS